MRSPPDVDTSISASAAPRHRQSIRQKIFWKELYIRIATHSAADIAAAGSAHSALDIASVAEILRLSSMLALCRGDHSVLAAGLGTFRHTLAMGSAIALGTPFLAT